jgi:putative protease
MKLPELLAPAGNYECLEAVFNHGADAAYIGIGPFNLRAQSPNFTPEEIPSVIDLAKKMDKRIYAVFNTMPNDTQLGMIEQFFSTLALQEFLPDAIIVSDPGILSLCKVILPGIALHLSTQTGTFNLQAMKFWAARGISRIILPRELNLTQIGLLSNAGVCETEIFIHGAMCVSISGRCLLGAYLSGRHPNQGECPQPCRYQYTIAPQTNNNAPRQWFDAEEDAQGVYLMNSKDLNTLSILPEIIATGVSSLKIEGRNKSVNYVSSVVKSYRAALDRYEADPGGFHPDKSWLEELENLDHRPYSTGFYGDDYHIQELNVSKVQSRIRVVGVVKGLMKGEEAVIDVKNPFSAHQEYSVLPVNHKKTPYRIVFSEITDFNGNNLERALTNRIVLAKSDQKLSIGDIIRKIVD